MPTSRAPDGAVIAAGGKPGTVTTMPDTSAPATPAVPQDNPVASLRRPGDHPDFDALPQRLSPSRAGDYLQCPKLFYFKTILGIREPGSVATTRGRLAHTAFERIFDHPAGERTVEVALSYIRPAWEEMICEQLDAEQFPPGSDAEASKLADVAFCRQLAPAGSAAETDLITSAEAVVRSWFQMERVNNFNPSELEMPDGSIIDGREFHAAASVLGVPLHGFIDRIDRWVGRDGTVYWSISDYKTGKRFDEGKQYSKAVMDRIADEAFLQLRIYAVLLQEMFGIQVSVLRLIYVRSGDRAKGIKTLDVTPAVLERTRGQMQSLWQSITTSARTGEWKTKTGPLCSYCYFNDVCPANGGAQLGELLPEEIVRRVAQRAA